MANDFLFTYESVSDGHPDSKDPIKDGRSVAYAVGVAKPMNVTVHTNGTGVIPDNKIAALVNIHFDLEAPEFTQTGTDRTAVLRTAAGLYAQTGTKR